MVGIEVQVTLGTDDTCKCISISKQNILIEYRNNAKYIKAKNVCKAPLPRPKNGTGPLSFTR